MVAAVAALGLVLAACGREEPPDLVNGKQLFVERCGSCHVLDRAGTAGTVGPSLDAAFRAARRAGIGEATIRGVVRDQIDSPLDTSQMPADLVKGENARDVAAYVAQAAAVPGEDEGELATVGPAGATEGDQIFTAAGCNACHTLADVGSTSDVGPSLDALAEVAGERTDLSPEDYVRQAILEPNAFVVEGFRPDVMPGNYGDQLTDEQVDTLVEYLLRVGGGG